MRGFALSLGGNHAEEPIPPSVLKPLILQARPVPCYMQHATGRSEPVTT